MKAFIRVASSNQVGFSNSSANDMLLFTSSNSQKILMGTNQGSNAGLAIVNNNVGIGNIAPTARLDVTPVTGQRALRVGTDFGINQDGLVVSGNGSVSVATSSNAAPQARLDVNAVFSHPPFANTPGYSGTASSQFNGSLGPNNAFDYNTGTLYATTSDSYSRTTGAYLHSNSTTVSGTAYTGEWIQLKLPSARVVNAMSFLGNGLRRFVIAGSQDETTWSAVLIRDSGSEPALNSGTTHMVTFANTTPYLVYRLIIREGIAGQIGGGFDVNELRFLEAPPGNRALRVGTASGGDGMVVDWNGNVGVGTATPGHRLDVAGTLRAGATGVTTSVLLGDSTDMSAGRFISALDSSLANGANRSITLGKSSTTNNQAEIYYTHNADGNTSNRLGLGVWGQHLHILANGNVGIGTTTPQHTLHVAGVGHFSGEFVGTSIHKGISLGHHGIDVPVIELVGNTMGWIDFAPQGLDFNGRIAYDHTKKEFQFNTTNTGGTRMVLNSNGNLGIGTTAPNAPLQFDNGVVERKIVMWEGANNNHEFHGLGVRSGQSLYQLPNLTSAHVFAAAAASNASRELMRVTGNATVGVNSSDPQARLDINAAYQHPPFANAPGYIPNASSHAHWDARPDLAFDYSTGGWGWATLGGYQQSTGNYTGSASTTASGTNYLGEWLQLQFPSARVVTGMRFAGTGVRRHAVLGSQNGTTWVLINDLTQNFAGAGGYGTGSTYTVAFANTTAYLFYRFVYMAAIANNFGWGDDTSKVRITELRFLEAPPGNRALRVGTASGGDGLVVDWNGNVGVGTDASATSAYEYPPAPLSGASTNITAARVASAIGTYTVSHSTNSSNGFRAFDKMDGTAWTTNTSIYSNTNYTGSVSTTFSTSSGSATISGEWLQITLPTAIVLQSYSIRANANESAPATWVLLGSNNGGTSWTLVDDQRSQWYGSSWWSRRFFTFAVSSGQAYSTYRIAISKKSDTGYVPYEYVGINEFTLNTLNTITTLNSAGFIRAENGFMGPASDAPTLPTYSWSGDLTTGMFRAGAQEIGIATGGVERMRISGNAFFLEVFGNGRFWSYVPASQTAASNVPTRIMSLRRIGTGNVSYDPQCELRLGKYSHDIHANTQLNFTLARWNTGEVDTNAFRIDADGKAYAGTSVSQTGADYAEMFEWADGNPDGEDRCGKTVVLAEGGVVRVASQEDDPATILGVVSATYSILGNNAWDHWHDRFLKDSLGRVLKEESTMVSWSNDAGQLLTYDSNCVPPGITPPESASYTTALVDKKNPAWDSNVTYVSRSERKEWAAIGLLGRLRIFNTAPKHLAWIKLRDIDADVAEYLVK
jgi:hypothetical protein